MKLNQMNLEVKSLAALPKEIASSKLDNLVLDFKSLTHSVIEPVSALWPY